MKIRRLPAVFLVGALIVGLSSCDAARTFGINTATKENFSSCVDKACFRTLKFARPIYFERSADGGGKVIYVTWSGAAWEKHRFENMQETLYIYFEVYFDANGSASNIRVGNPLCAFNDEIKRKCRILFASEISTSQID